MCQQDKEALHMTETKQISNCTQYVQTLNHNLHIEFITEKRISF